MAVYLRVIGGFVGLQVVPYEGRDRAQRENQQHQQKNQPSSTPVLTAGALDSLSEEERRAREFGQDRDDFYPTERHAHPKEKNFQPKEDKLKP